jgi:hypothetical protein
MRKNYQRRTAARYSTSGHPFFGGAGWLFADLLLALALAFLLATTVGTPPPKKPPTTSQPHNPGSHPKQPVPLVLVPHRITFTIADPAGLVTGSPSAIAAVRASILRKTHKIRFRSAGIVLLFGSNSPYPTYEQVDQQVEKILKSLSTTGSLFHQRTRYRRFLSLHGANQFSMDVYLLSRPTSST